MTGSEREDAILAGLKKEERDFLAAGASNWGGASRPSDALALALGLGSTEVLADEGMRVSRKLRSEERLTPDEALFALVSTEIVFASDRWGAGWDWEIVSGYSDTESIAILRSIQRKLVGIGNWPWP